MRMLVDAVCPGCGDMHTDVWIDRDHPDYPRCRCGPALVRHWGGAGPAVHGDDIPGGVLIHHGICHDDGTPRRYYSKSEMARAAQARGLTNWVEHVGDRGSDKNPHTQRFV